MEKLKEKIEETGAHLIEFYETQTELKKMQLMGKTSKVFSSASSILLVAFIFLLVILFASVAAAFVISTLTGHRYLGFLVVALLYLLLGILLLVNRKRWIETPLMNSMIKAFYKNDHED